MSSDFIGTYATMVRDTADRTPDADALVFPAERRTYRELMTAGERRARQLRALGVAPGDRFGVLMPNCIDLVELLLGGALLGATVVPINSRYKAHELRHVIADGELVAVVTTDAIDEFVDFAEQLYASLPGLRESRDPRSLSLPGFTYLRAVAMCGSREADGIVRMNALDGQRAPGSGAGPRPEDPLLIMYTSGTTANPKGCVLSNAAMVHNAHAIVERLEIPAGDRWWDPLPLFHMGGIMLLSSVFAAGGAFMSEQHFQPQAALQFIDRERPTVLYPLFPTIALDLIHHPDFASGDYERVRLMGSVAPYEVQQRLQAALPNAVLFSAFGITELCGCVAYNALDDTLEQRLRTCGRALPGFDLRVVDPDDNTPLPPGERGELVGRGVQMFDGYYANSQATAAVIDEHGYFHTGDLCSMSEDGLVTYHGRIKDMLKVGGENVSALEIESLLATHPAIKLAQIVGVPDERLLEVPVAFVELAPNSELAEEEVVSYCAGRVASFKVPRHVRFVTEWPMSATKIQKFRLRERMIAELDGLQTPTTESE